MCLQIITFMLVSLGKTATSVSQNNVLFIIVDDLRHLSKETINLPNIQSIAKSGAYFNNAFSQVIFYFLIYKLFKCIYFIL